MYIEVAAVCRVYILQVYSTATYEKLSTLNGHTGTVHSISISPDDRCKPFTPDCKPLSKAVATML